MGLSQHDLHFYFVNLNPPPEISLLVTLKFLLKQKRMRESNIIILIPPSWHLFHTLEDLPEDASLQSA